MSELTRQVEIVHLSDIHFGSAHRFQAGVTPAGDKGAGAGIPTLLEKLEEDLKGIDAGSPVITCLTGDLTTTASYGEFKAAEAFVRGLATIPIRGLSRGIDSIFIVPGNHDVNYTGEDVGERWQGWVELNNRLFKTTIPREKPWELAKVHHLKEQGLVVTCLNSAIYIQKDTVSEMRGEVDEEQLAKIHAELSAISKDELDNTIRIALIHHHPVLIPTLVEANRGYDAVLNSVKLLNVLHEFGFHLLLHGHKHFPVMFLDEISSAFHDSRDQPLMIVAGGSAGSTGLPEHPKTTNSYNHITVKWHPQAGQARIQVVTRGLSLYTPQFKERLAKHWEWETLKVEDRVFVDRSKSLPSPQVHGWDLVTVRGEEPGREHERRAQYERSRGNLPAVEVMPSLIPEQAYEARVWIVPHKRRTEDVPVEVIWSAGPRFPSLSIRQEVDPTFCAVFDYWGPVLVQGELRFVDGSSVLVHIYARIPHEHR